MSLKELLAELQKEYLATFPAKVVLISDLWRKREMTELETEYHKMKGTGRTYGLPEVSQVGEALERLCEVAPDQLEKAVPLSLQVLTKIRAHRERGETLSVEIDPDFQAIVQLVMKADKAKAP